MTPPDKPVASARRLSIAQMERDVPEGATPGRTEKDESIVRQPDPRVVRAAGPLLQHAA
jgi:hypothetical protein